MVLDEIYTLTKHSNFTPEYLELIPVYKRRYFINRLKEDIDAIEKEHEKISRRTR